MTLKSSLHNKKSALSPLKKKTVLNCKFLLQFYQINAALLSIRYPNPKLLNGSAHVCESVFYLLFYFSGCPSHLTYSITVCVHLAVAVSSGLIAVSVKAFTGFTVAGSTCRAAPPTTRTLLLDPTNTHTHTHTHTTHHTHHTVRFDQIPMYLGQI